MTNKLLPLPSFEPLWNDVAKWSAAGPSASKHFYAQAESTLTKMLHDYARAHLATQQAEPVGNAPTWNSIQIASWIGSQLMHEPSMFERSAVCKFVRSLGRHPTLLKHSPETTPTPQQEGDMK